MVHLYELNGYYIAIDQNSGCVHALDQATYAVLSHFDETGIFDEEARRELLQQEALTEAELDEILEEIEELKKQLVRLSGGKDININIVEVANPDLDARLVALKIVKMLEERHSFRTAQKRAIQQTMRSGAKGIKTMVSGRLGGADIARSEGYSEGSVSLHTLRSDIDYAWEEAMTAYGKLGVKVWICRGEVLPGEMVKEPERPKSMGRPQRDRRPRRDAGRREEAPAAEAAAVEAPAAEETVVKEDAE